MSPHWLPDLTSVNGSWDEARGQLYAVFSADFIHGSPRFRNLPVRHDARRLNGDQFEERFWHLVTVTDRQTGDRLIDPPRAKRLKWCRATIDYAESAEVVEFDYEEGTGEVRRYLWLTECDYLVVLAKRSKGGHDAAFFLITAFYLDGPSSRRRIQRKFEQRQP